MYKKENRNIPPISGRNGNKQNIHHIVPQSRSGSNEEQNKILLYEELHQAFHRVYGNATPKEQILQRLLINEKALGEFRKDVYNLLKETDDRYYYKKGVLVY